jgi:SAM-dependent methyltransferase
VKDIRDDSGSLVTRPASAAAPQEDLLTETNLPPPGVGVIPLPPQNLRAAGQLFAEDEAFLARARRDVELLRIHTGLGEDSSLLDFGCGVGRLAIGLKSTGIDIRFYLGVDVRSDVIAWARRHLADERFRFVRVNSRNERYNSNGSAYRRLPAPSESMDILYAYSVFSHMLAVETRAYVSEIARVLRPGGFAFLTAFVEDDVPDVTENPPEYGPLSWQGRLHCVRMNRSFFDEVLADAGLEITRFDHATETDGQSLYVVMRGPGV